MSPSWRLLNWPSFVVPSRPYARNVPSSRTAGIGCDGRLTAFACSSNRIASTRTEISWERPTLLHAKIPSSANPRVRRHGNMDHLPEEPPLECILAEYDSAILGRVLSSTHAVESGSNPAGNPPHSFHDFVPAPKILPRTPPHSLSKLSTLACGTP